MKERLGFWWSDLVDRRGATELLFDLWLVSIVVALLIGFALGFAAR